MLHYTSLEMLTRDKHSSFLCPFVSYEKMMCFKYNFRPQSPYSLILYQNQLGQVLIMPSQNTSIKVTIYMRKLFWLSTYTEKNDVSSFSFTVETFFRNVIKNVLSKTFSRMFNELLWMRHFVKNNSRLYSIMLHLV